MKAMTLPHMRFLSVFKEDQRITMRDSQHKSDPVNHPVHYTIGSIEVIDFIEAWKLDFCTGNVVKYVVRAPHKGNELEDLEKARFYLDKLIARHKKASP